MFKKLRKQIIHNLWNIYLNVTPQMKTIENGLKQKGVGELVLDHFAIIDLPGPHTGISYLSQIFAALGYVERGKDYLADKQNDFLWMAEDDSEHALAQDVLPQVVVADFRLDEMPSEIRNIIEKYARHSNPIPLKEIKQLIDRTTLDPVVHQQFIEMITTYFSGRDWPLPTLNEYQTVRDFNELLAWVLVFGRRPNHFTISVHLLHHFSNLNEFLHFVENEMFFTLNRDGGEIKGGEKIGIAQGSTNGVIQTTKMADGIVEIPTGFVEFVWRYPSHPTTSPRLWKDYFTGFVAQHADRVIESLYSQAR